MKKVLVIFGTRPEGIKLAPVINELQKFPQDFKTVVCVTGQHRLMLDHVLRFFGIVPDYDLNIMSADQDLFDVTSNALIGLREVIKTENPDWVLVQGDTTTAFVGSLAAFYLKIPTAHVEAGLRTYNKYHPYPEEKNRQMVAVLADLHFAPTDWAKNNLLNEKVSEQNILVTGNTCIDALLTATKILNDPAQDRIWKQMFRDKWGLDLSVFDKNKKLILVTGHRRESFGEAFRKICKALKEIALRNKDTHILYPVHLNPNVREPVFSILKPNRTSEENNNIHLIDPLEYAPFVYLMNKAHFILTDSGGIQEEAPSLGKPVLVMRNNTERPEGVEAGMVKLVGTEEERIVTEAQTLLDCDDVYREMSKPMNPYGDGRAAEKIAAFLRNHPLIK